MSAILPPSDRLWWKQPLDRIEGTWIVIAAVRSTLVETAFGSRRRNMDRDCLYLVHDHVCHDGWLAHLRQAEPVDRNLQDHSRAVHGEDASRGGQIHRTHGNRPENPGGASACGQRCLSDRASLGLVADPGTREGQDLSTASDLDGLQP